MCGNAGGGGGGPPDVDANTVEGLKELIKYEKKCNQQKDGELAKLKKTLAGGGDAAGKSKEDKKAAAKSKEAAAKASEADQPVRDTSAILPV